MMRSFTAAVLLVSVAVIPAYTQAPAPAAAPTAKPATAGAPVATTPTAKPATTGAPVATGGVATPADYVIGADDQLEIVFWREKEMSAQVTVRPDGMISLPLLNDVRAAGLTPEELRASVAAVAEKLIEQPTVSVIVKAVNSRRVFITGQVGKPGPYPLLAPTTVLQMIATAGGLSEYADGKNIRIVRDEGGKQVAHKFSYEDVTKGKALDKNILLKPGDTVVVP